MDNRWSNYVQTPLEIDSHRELRFRDKYKESIIEGIGAKSGMTVVDVGCGAGTLTRKLSDWLGNSSKIIGIDRDSGFIEYSKDKAKRLGYDIEYINANAYNIPLPDNSVDITTSHTVIEHVDHERFILEQKRIVKSGGRVSIMSARPERSVYIPINDTLNPMHSYNENDEEIELRELVKKACEYDIKHSISKVKYAHHGIEIKDMPVLLESLGFSNIRIEGVSITNAIDDERNSFEYKLKEIDEYKNGSIEQAKKAHLMNPNIVTKKHLNKIIEYAEKRKAYRINEVDNNRRKWDFSIVLLVIVSGVVNK